MVSIRWYLGCPTGQLRSAYTQGLLGPVFWSYGGVLGPIGGLGLEGVWVPLQVAPINPIDMFRKAHFVARESLGNIPLS